MRTIALLALMIALLGCGGSSDSADGRFSLIFRAGTTSVGGTVFTASASSARTSLSGVTVRVGSDTDVTDSDGQFLVELGEEEVDAEFVVLELSGNARGVVSYPNNGEYTATTVEITEDEDENLSLVVTDVQDVPEEEIEIDNNGCVRLEDGFYRGDNGCGIGSTNLTVAVNLTEIGRSRLTFTPFGSNGSVVFRDTENGQATSLEPLVINQTGDSRCTIICGPPSSISLNCRTGSGALCAESLVK